MRRLIGPILADIKKTIFLTKEEFRRANASSFLGCAWLFIQPISYVMAVGFIVGFGIRGDKNLQTDYLQYIFWGIACWQITSSILSQSASVFVSYSYLIKRGNFPIYILPAVKILREVVIHTVVFLSILIMFAFNGIHIFKVENISVLYYLFSLLILLNGVSIILASISLFISDIKNFMQIVVMFGFWLTPVLYKIENLPYQIQQVLKLNPILYIIEGYRNSLIHSTWFWLDLHGLIKFWIFVLCINLIAIYVFKRTSKHFADVV